MGTPACGEQVDPLPHPPITGHWPAPTPPTISPPSSGSQLVSSHMCPSVLAGAQGPSWTPWSHQSTGVDPQQVVSPHKVVSWDPVTLWQPDGRLRVPAYPRLCRGSLGGQSGVLWWGENRAGGLWLQHRRKGPATTLGSEVGPWSHPSTAFPAAQLPLGGGTIPASRTQSINSVLDVNRN